MPTGVLAFLSSSPSFGGLEMNLVRLASWMRERGWNALIYALAGSPVEAFARKKGLPVEPIATHWKYGDLLAGLRLRGALHRDHVRFLVISHNRDLNVAALAKWFSGGAFKLIYYQAMGLGVSKRDPFHTALFTAIDTWLSPLDSLAAEVRARTRIAREKIHVAPPGTEMTPFTENPLDKSGARRELGLDGSRACLGIIGRLERGKGQHVVIEALARLRRRGHDVELLVVGEPTRGHSEAYASHLHELVDRHGLREVVHFRPFTDKPEIAFAALDIFVMATMSETFGLVTVEAMASALPVVGTNSGGTIEILDHGRAGLLFTPGDPGDLCEKIHSLLTDPETMRRLGETARSRALERYAHNVTCDTIERLLATAAGSS